MIVWTCAIHRKWPKWETWRRLSCRLTRWHCLSPSRRPRRKLYQFEVNKLIVFCFCLICWFKREREREREKKKKRRNREDKEKSKGKNLYLCAWNGLPLQWVYSCHLLGELNITFSMVHLHIGDYSPPVVTLVIRNEIGLRCVCVCHTGRFSRVDSRESRKNPERILKESDQKLLELDFPLRLWIT